MNLEEFWEKYPELLAKIPEGQETFALELHVTEANPKTRTFKGIAAAFDTIIDSWIPTIIQKGAFEEAVKIGPDNVKVLHQHNPERVLGKLLAMEETSKGLEVEGMISETSLGKDILTLMEDAVLTEMSIGFKPMEWIMDEDHPRVNGPLRTLTELALDEVSIVVFPANAPSRITEVNSVLGDRAKEFVTELEEEPEVVPVGDDLGTVTAGTIKGAEDVKAIEIPGQEEEIQVETMADLLALAEGFLSKHSESGPVLQEEEVERVRAVIEGLSKLLPAEGGDGEDGGDSSGDGDAEAGEVDSLLMDAEMEMAESDLAALS